MKKWCTLGAVLLSLTLLGLAALPWQKTLVWNRTDSAPIGLYWVKNDPLTYDRWVVISPKSDVGKWAIKHGFVGRDWPLLKRVSGVSGDEICRVGALIFINGAIVGMAQNVDSNGRKLPRWTGCQVVEENEVFLLNEHPKSLDGRYFGVTHIDDVDGVAVLLFESRS